MYGLKDYLRAVIYSGRVSYPASAAGATIQITIHSAGGGSTNIRRCDAMIPGTWRTHLRDPIYVPNQPAERDDTPSGTR